MPATETARDVVMQALKKSGVIGQGRAPTATELDDGMSDFNDMVALWNTQRWLVWHLLDLGVTSTGAQTYTVGPGGTFNVSRRPDRLEAAYQRQTNNNGLPVDTPIKVIEAREQYSRISLKTLTSFGLYCFLDSAWPLGTVYMYPIPNATIYEIHLLMKDVVPVFDPNTVMSALPDHYIPAFKFNLARTFRQHYGKGLRPDPELNRFANATLDTVKNSNLQIPELVMPKGLVRSSGYNILSDQF